MQRAVPTSQAFDVVFLGVKRFTKFVFEFDFVPNVVVKCNRKGNVKDYCSIEAENYKKAGNLEQSNTILEQKEVLVKYLPQMMSEEEIKAEIAKLEDKSIPSVMKHFKANFAGKVDMGLVNKIARG